MPVGDYNFNAQSHQQLYEKIHRNTNGSAADATNDAWNSFRAVMANAKAEVESALRDAKVVWTGAAGESFGSGVAPLVQWAEGARAAGVDTHNAFQAQQSYFTGTRDRMPEPVQLSDTSNSDYLGIPAGFTHLVGGQTDQDIEEQKANEAKREAVRVMSDYRGNAADAVSSVGTFTEPPRVTLDVAEPKIEQSEAQQQYSQEFNKRFGTDTNTNDRNDIPPPDQQQEQPDVVTPPPAVPQHDGDTNVSDANSPTQVRPGPLPITPPVHVPTPGPPTYTTPIPAPIRQQMRQDRLGGGKAPTGKGQGVGNPRLGAGAAPGQPGQQPGRGPSSVIGAGEPHASGRPGAGSAGGARGGAGTPGMGMAGAPQGKPGEEDKEHKAAPYLEEIEDVWGENDIRVAPPVLGDDQQ